MNEPKTPEEALARVQEAAQDGKVEFTSTEEVEALQEYVDKIIYACALGMGKDPKKFKCWISDRTSIGDFSPASETDRRNYYGRVSAELGLEVFRGELVIDLARRMMN